MKEKILVTGASGNLGRLTIQSLLATGCENLVALVRNPDSVADLAAQGVEVRSADYLRPESLDLALKGITRLLLISSNSVHSRAQEHRNVIAAARRQAVQGIVYTSVLHADRWELPIMQDHINTETAIRESGLEWTFLRNGWYWENHTPRLASAIVGGVLIGCSGSARISWASRQDYADAAAIVLSSPGHVGMVYELAGDHAFFPGDLAHEASIQTEKTIVFQNMTEAAFADILGAAGIPHELASVFAELEARGVATGILEDHSRTLSHLIGRPTTSLSTAVAQALAAPVASQG